MRLHPFRSRQGVGCRSREPEFHGFTARRRTISFGWHYDFAGRALHQADDLPAWLLPQRKVAADVAGLAPDHLPHVLILEYSAGAAIGWHRDKAVFGDVIGFSLLSPGRFRRRRKAGTRWERTSLIVEPRSAYVLRGPSRTEWSTASPRWTRGGIRSRFRTSRPRNPLNRGRQSVTSP